MNAPQSKHDPYPLIAPGSTTQTLQQPIAWFRNFFDARVSSEQVLDLQGLFDVVASIPKMYKEKKNIPLVILGEIRSAPYIGGTAEKYGPGPGKQRSNNHIATLGPGIQFDVDRVPVEEVAKQLTARGIAYIVYTSHSSGEENKAEGKVKGRGRLDLFLDGTWTPAEHKAICAAINRGLLDGAADRSAFAAPQGFAIHAIKTKDQPAFTDARHGQLLSLAKIRALIPEKTHKPGNLYSTSGLTPPGNFENERAEFSEIGALGTADEYKHWFDVIAGIKRSYKDDSEKALELADAISRNAASYKGRDDVEDKLVNDVGSVDHDGPTIELARTWARTDAIDIITRAFSDAAGATDNVVPFPDQNPDPDLGPIPDAFKGKPIDASNFLGGIEIAGSGRSADNLHLRTDPASVRRATAYLARWWPPKWIDELRAKYPLDAALIEQCKAEYAERTRIEVVADRELVVWDPTHAGRGVDAVAAGIVAYARKSGLVWSDGNALWKIVGNRSRAVPIINKEDVDALTNETICEEFRFKNDNDEWESIFRSFDFKPSTSGNSGPNHIRLLSALKLVVTNAPQCKGFIRQPTLAALPGSYSNLGEPRVIDKPGFDQASGLYLLRGGVTVTVPLKYEPVAFDRAYTLVDSLIGDFNYANNASRAGAWAAMLIAGTRGTLANAPHIGIRTPHAGQGGGKSTKSETYVAVAADGDPVERTMNLARDISDTGTMIFRHLLERPEALAITNIDLSEGREFRSPQLLDLATNGHIDGKLLYSNKAGSMTVRSLVALSGNELRLDMHLARRTLMLELLRPDQATPRKIRVPDPQRYVMAHRSEVIAAILTLIIAYWDRCRMTGGRPKKIEHLCKGRTSTFADPGVDFLLDAATYLTGGIWGSAYDAFDTGKKKSVSYNDDLEGLALIEQAMADIGATPTGYPVRQLAARQQLVSAQHPATAEELWLAFPASSVDRIAMGEILNRRRPNPNWGPKSLADWLNARVGLDRGPGVPQLKMSAVARRRAWWFA